MNTKSTTHFYDNNDDSIHGSSKQGHNLSSTEEPKFSVSRRIIMQQTILFQLEEEDDGDMIHTLEQKPCRKHREARRKKYEDATEATNKT